MSTEVIREGDEELARLVEQIEERIGIGAHVVSLVCLLPDGQVALVAPDGNQDAVRQMLTAVVWQWTMEDLPS